MSTATPTAPTPLVAAEGDHTYKFNVTMTCGGCSGAVERVLKKLDGVKEQQIDMASQTVTIIAADSLDYKTVLTKIAKTGKKVNSGEADGEEKSVVVDAE